MVGAVRKVKDEGVKKSIDEYPCNPKGVGNCVYTEVLTSTLPYSTVYIHIRVKKGYDWIIPAPIGTQRHQQKAK